MSYTLHFSDPTAIATITVPSRSVSSPGINDYDTSLQLIGSGYPNYGLPTAQNFLKLLENFAGPSQPTNAIKGQLWYDTTVPSKPVLRVNNGTNTSGRWPSANGIYQQTTDPTVRYTEITDGDIWVDTANNKLKIRFENKWTIVGPETPTGQNKSGTETTTLESNTGDSYPVILQWANGKIVEIISLNSFVPRTVIDGFPTIKVGTNLTSSVVAKYNGLAEKASLLEVSPGVSVGASDLLKNRTIRQIHTGTFYVESSIGLYVRPSATATPVRIYSDLTNNGYVNYYGTTLQIGTQDTSYLKFNSGYASVGINKTPSSGSPTLDVAGGGQFTDVLSITSSATVALSITGGALVGGKLAAGSLVINGKTTSTDKLTLGAAGSGIILEPAISDVYDIGSPTKKFRSIYISDVFGVDNFRGSITGSAGSLTVPRAFLVVGQVTATSVSFNGTSDITFNTQLTRSAIANQTTATSTTATQTLLVLNTATITSNLERISKSNFLSDVYPNLFQTGMITAFGTSTNIPPGFLACNGATKTGSLYPDLYALIGTTYGLGGLGTFKTPNMSATTSVSPGVYLTYIIKT